MRIRTLFMAAVFVVAGFQNMYSQQDASSQRMTVTTSSVIFAKPTEMSGDFKGMLLGNAVFESNPIKNAPYSAEAVNETVTVLADGNRIVKSSTTKIFRDSEGRTRRETVAGNSPAGITIPVSGLFGPTMAPALGAIPQTQIQINDPVAGTNYVLDPETHAATKYAPVPSDPNIADAITRAKRESTLTGKAVTIREGNSVVSVNTLTVPGESLGTKMIEGLECNGTLSSTTIPAGQIGNEKPIVVTTERWYSRKLQAEVLVKTNDPRSGENTYKLVNVDQSEPPTSLFLVPSDYTIVDMAEKTKELLKRIEIIQK